MIKEIIIGLLFIIITIACFESAFQTISKDVNDPNIHYTELYSSQLKKMIDYRFVLYGFIIIGILSFMFVPLKEIEYPEDEDIKDKPKRQTYYDYVVERLKIERIMKQ